MIKTQLCIATDKKELIYNVEVAVTKEDKLSGLINRDSIPEMTGMLYDFHEHSGEINMCAKGNKVAVDFLFADSSGRIFKISQGNPLSSEIHTAQDAAWILEINTGEAAANGVQIGDVIYGEMLGNQKAFHDNFPINAKYFRYDSQIFAKNELTLYMYSFGSHCWIDTQDDPEVSNNFALKLKSYEEQEVPSISMTEQEVKNHIKDYEQKFKEDFRKTQSEFYVRNNECIIKEYIPDNKLYLYIYGKGWEEIEWWDHDKQNYKISVYLCCLRKTSTEIEKIIQDIEKNKKKIQKANSSSEDFVERPSFMGEHFEALGNIWETMGFSDFKDLQTYINKLGKNMEYPIRKDAPLPENERLFMQYMQIVYHDFGIMLGFAPKLDADMQVALLLKKKENGLDFLSGYPFMKGYPTEVTIEGYHTWENGFEGVFTADLHNTTDIAWFDPFYLYTKNIKPLNKKAKIMFSGLALRLEESKSNIITIDHGGLYEVELKRFLEENPGKTATDMPPVQIEMGKGTALLPTSTVTEYEYQAKVNHVQTCMLGDKKVCKMEVTALRDLGDDTSFILNLYAFEHILNGYKPKKGDFVRGVMWLQGYPELIDNKK